MSNKSKANRAQRRLQERRQRRSGHTASVASQPRAQGQSRWHAAPADRRASIEGLDGHSHLRNVLRDVARERGEWAGIPMPLDGESLVVEPSYPHAKELMAIGGEKEEPHELDKAVVRNQWYALHRRADVVVFTRPNGRVDWGMQPAFHAMKFAMSTLGCSDAWGIEQESKAVQLLGTLVSHRQFKQYMLTGMFLERSKRSGVFYLFRRLRPTVAIRADHGQRDSKILCALCMHPIGYYSGSWAGAMCPTDDVVAHLMLMRADERLFWARCNQHPAYRPEAGL